METGHSQAVPRHILKAVLEVRDHRHNETHAILLAMFQALAAELVEQGALMPQPLADRLARAHRDVAPVPHGAPARDMLAQVVGWLRMLEPGLPPSHPGRWHAPPVPEGEF